MCGIFGFMQTPKSREHSNKTKEFIEELCLLSETRGKDASGLVAVTPDAIHTLKRPIRAQHFLKSKDFSDFYKTTASALSSTAPSVFMGHTRMITNGDCEKHENNQPCISEATVCIHNGIVVNEPALWEEFNIPARKDVVDTKTIVDVAELTYDQIGNFAHAIQKTYTSMKGANSIACIHNTLDALFLASANGSLFVAIPSTKDLVIFASEKYILQAVIERKDLGFTTENPFTITQVHAGTMCVIPFSNHEFTPEFASLTDVITTKIPDAAQTRTIIDMPPVKPAAARPVYTGVFSKIEKLCDVDRTPINSMKRCSKCLLPESFPFIHFDEEGVCNYCHAYQHYSPNGSEPLKKILHPERKTNGAPDCLVPVSGGRDSSYALHCICKELGMTPVAYTYDWGMVTDLARRNISRMCGELGIEHILISANIKQKRANIRKNVLAWLKKPHLGAVTLFMAGDKPYYYYAYMLRRQMGLKYTLLGANHLERTDFKVGFCEIDEKFGKDRHYSLNLQNKFKLLGFFGKQFLTNPSYLNASLADSFLGFASYYILPADYVSLYDYIHWDEDTINNTLLGSYDWETATDTNSTWRIGDGTAAFYNYIYYKMAGFSENDTFRSNQIRQGIITREEGLQQAHTDNTPRVESIIWYCDTIGIDPVKTLKTINNAKTLYRK